MISILRFLILVLCFGSISTNELKQNQAEKNFSLKCQDGEYVSSFGANFTRDGNDRRRYRIRCQKLKTPEKSTCKSSKETEIMKYSDEDVGCDQNEYLGGFESTKYKNGDRRFRLICCQTTGQVISESTCRQVQTRIQQNFTQKLSDDEVIHKLTSKFSLWEQNRRFVVDRRWSMTVCKIGNASEIETSNSNGNNDTTVGSNVDSDKISSPPNTTFCKIGQNQNFVPPSGQDVIHPGKNTQAFKSFRIYCPNGYGIKSIRIVAKIDAKDRKDTTFNVNCEKLPFDDVTSCLVQRKEAPFKEDNEIREMSSVQSPCDITSGQFLCGLSGVYTNNRRRLTGTCCVIKDIFPSSQVEPVLGDPTDEGFAVLEGVPSKKHYLVNLDQLPGGSFVGHMTTFFRVYLEQGQSVSTSSGCHCKCPCKCPLEQQLKHHITTSAETRRKRRSKIDCNSIDCSCKCILPCDK